MMVSNMNNLPPIVMPGLDPGIHEMHQQAERWMDCRVKPTAVRFSDIGCKVLVSTLVMIVITGLDPVIHAFLSAPTVPAPARGLPEQVRQ
jgi:hypothetical protein